MAGLTETLENHGEKIKLLIYFVVMIAVAGPLFLTLGEAWRDSHFIRPIIISLDPILSITLAQFASFAFGTFLGLLVLLTLDPKKRVQGILLWVGTATALAALSSIGLFLPNLGLGQNYGWVAAGVVIGVLLGGGRKLTEVQTAEAREFRRSALLLYYVLTLVVVVGLLEYHLQYPEVFTVSQQGLVLHAVTPSISVDTSGIFTNLLMSGVFVVTLGRFVKYDSDEQFFVLGPRGSGKSLFLVGAYLAALEDAESRDSDTPLNPSSDLMDLVGTLDAADSEAGWNVDSTGAQDIEDLSFQFIDGTVFPKNIGVSSLDYAGEYLERLPDVLMNPDQQVDDTTLQRLAERVQGADTIVLLVDVERYHNNEKLGIEPYFDILNVASGKDIILVATKADILADQFREQQSLEAHQYFDDFREFTNETLRENSQAVRTLVQDTSGSKIHPVYYQTKVTDDGERVPLRDRNGNTNRFGFDELLTKLR